MPVRFPEDHVPQIMLAGTSGLARGISGGLGQLARGFEERQERLKREASIGKSSKALLKAMGDDAGLHPNEIDSMSSADAAAAASAIIGKQHYERGKREAQMDQMKMAELASAARNRESEGAFLGDVSRYAPPGQLPQGLTPEQFDQFSLPEGQTQVGLRELAASAARTGYRPNLAQFDDILRAAAAAGGGAEPDLEAFREDPITGQRYFVKGKQVLPSGTNPDRVQGPQPQLDENGTLLGHIIHTGGRAGVFKPAALPDTLTAAQRLNALQRQYTALVALPTPENRKAADEVHRQIQKLMDTPAPGPSKRSDTGAAVRNPTAVNPATGQRLELRDGQWVPLE